MALCATLFASLVSMALDLSAGNHAHLAGTIKELSAELMLTSTARDAVAQSSAAATIALLGTPTMGAHVDGTFKLWQRAHMVVALVFHWYAEVTKISMEVSVIRNAKQDTPELDQSAGKTVSVTLPTSEPNASRIPILELLESQ